MVGCSPAILCKIDGPALAAEDIVRAGRASDIVTGPGRAVNDIVTGPGRAFNDIVEGPGRAFNDIVTGPGRAFKDIVTGPGRALDNLTSPFRPVPAPEPEE